ncbi:MAG TPA: methyltransferase [Acidimicrobiales bacterium]|nr:methyltransferase [Acidimicrobiales bacterium]
MLFAFDDPDDFARVRDVLKTADYTDSGVVGIVGTGGAPFGPRRVPPLLRRTSGGSPLETLIRLFIVGVEVPLAAANAALAPMSAARWTELGLLRATEDGVAATVQLRCWQHLVVAFDWLRRTPDGGIAPDYVMGISPSTLGLASLTIRQPYGRALDLGTGSGFHALVAAGHTEHVVATDRNARAVEFTAFNAGLNGLKNVEPREGDLFVPVEGERFDLVVSNPPFIISPDFKHLFLSTELKGDELCQRLAREVPAFLQEGGWCQFLANWAILRGQSWDERLSTWFAGSGCDVWVNQRTTQAPDEYAATWIETEGSDLDEFARFFDTWMSYYDAQGIEAVGFGLVTMRKASRPAGNWFRASALPQATQWGAGEDVERCFLLHDLMARTDDAALLDMVLTLAPDVRLHRECSAKDGMWQTESARVARSSGLGYTAGIDEIGADLLASCDRARPVSDLVASVASSTGNVADEIAAGVVAIVRSLIACGMLVPAGDVRPA